MSSIIDNALPESTLGAARKYAGWLPITRDFQIGYQYLFNQFTVSLLANDMSRTASSLLFPVTPSGTIKAEHCRCMVVIAGSEVIMSKMPLSPMTPCNTNGSCAAGRSSALLTRSAHSVFSVVESAPVSTATWWTNGNAVSKSRVLFTRKCCVYFYGEALPLLKEAGSLRAMVIRSSQLVFGPLRSKQRQNQALGICVPAKCAGSCQWRPQSLGQAAGLGPLRWSAITCPAWSLLHSARSTSASRSVGQFEAPDRKRGMVLSDLATTAIQSQDIE